MEIILTDDEVRKIDEVGELTGLEKREIVKRALTNYLENSKEMQRLENEIQSWDELSDEALINFEKENEKRRDLAC